MSVSVPVPTLPTCARKRQIVRFKDENQDEDENEGEDNEDEDDEDKKEDEDEDENYYDNYMSNQTHKDLNGERILLLI